MGFADHVVSKRCYPKHNFPIRAVQSVERQTIRVTAPHGSCENVSMLGGRFGSVGQASLGPSRVFLAQPDSANRWRLAFESVSCK
jgi:hypothetical protein